MPKFKLPDIRKKLVAPGTIKMSNILYEPIKIQSVFTDKVIVSFSGGKDSVTTLDLISRYFDYYNAFFLYIVPGLEFQERFLHWYERRYNINILRLPHPDTSLFLKYGTFRASDLSVPEVSFNDIYNYVRQKTGIKYIATGERINDSIIRRATLKKSGSIDTIRGKIYPVLYWNKKQIYEYIKRRRLLLPADSKLIKGNFSSLSGSELSIIKKHFPNDYKKILDYYPLCDLSVFKYEKFNQ